MWIIKLGGAAITDKTRDKTVNAAALQRIAASLARTTEPLIVVHGAGSFGHILADQYALQAGYHSPAQLVALPQLQAQLADLHQHVLAALRAAGMRAWGIPPAAVSVLQGGRIAEFLRSRSSGRWRRVWCLCSMAIASGTARKLSVSFPATSWW
ncbi:MAG: hypothetical protein HC915_19815 [Anaerolineae bacterium]|nr:hypothetical protein [Anaerolineae bacterium]